MFWDKFEKELKYAYAVVDRRAQRVVHDDEAKLRSLVNDRIRADFLKMTNSILKIQLGGVSLTLAFQSVIDSLRNEVNTYNRKPSSIMRDSREISLRLRLKGKQRNVWIQLGKSSPMVR